MEEIDRIFQEALDNGSICGALLLGRNVQGNVNISRSYGYRSLANAGGAKPLAIGLDSPMRIASASKFLTSIMVLGCVERGEISLDSTLEDVLPEVARQKVIVGFNEAVQKPILRDPKSAITLRQLLSHSSGLSYATASPLLAQLRTSQGREVEQGYSNLDENFDMPLTYDPGCGWEYSPGLDWASRLIARLSGLSAEEYLQKYVVQPLGLTNDDLSFNLPERPSMNEKRANVVTRGTDGKLRHSDEDYWTAKNEASGGQGIFANARAYFKVMTSILLNDGKLLRPETQRLLFEPTLSPEADATLQEKMTFYRGVGWGFGMPIPDGTRVSHSLGGLLAMEDCKGVDGKVWRRKGSVSWSGITNIFWNIDPLGEVITLWAFHLKPFCDPICLDLGTKFEKAFYQMVENRSS